MCLHKMLNKKKWERQTLQQKKEEGRMKYEIRTRVSPVHTANIALINVKIWDFVCAFYCLFRCACAHFSLRKKNRARFSTFCANYSFFNIRKWWMTGMCSTDRILRKVYWGLKKIFRVRRPHRAALDWVSLSFSLNLVRLRPLTRQCTAILWKKNLLFFKLQQNVFL
jgi:hypothetical protein